MDINGFDITNYKKIGDTSVARADCYNPDTNTYQLGYLLSNKAGAVTYLPEARDVVVSQSGKVAHTDITKRNLYLMDLETAVAEIIAEDTDITALSWGEELLTYYNSFTNKVVTVDTKGNRIDNASFSIVEDSRIENITWAGSSMVILQCYGEIPGPTDDCKVVIYQ
jgi:hypothetical protein